MHDFMGYCLRCYYRSSGWNEENQYSNLCSWSRALLDFDTPRGLSLYLSKLPTPQFKPSYTMNAFPSLNGSIGYLYTSRPLDVGTSASVDFQDMVDRFRFRQPTLPETTDDNKSEVKDDLLYGRMFFPGAWLEAMYVRRLSKHVQFLATGINHPRIPTPEIAMQLRYDAVKWCSEASYTTDNGLLGIRALYNFGQSTAQALGQWSIGTEVYYRILDKGGGLSTGLRYRTHPLSASPPTSFTYTLNPVVGHMSTAYATQVSKELALCSRFDFNIYSYESDLALGLEYRTKSKPSVAVKEDGIVTLESERTEQLEGLIKARIGFVEGLALMWEGRFKNTLFSLGLTADLSNGTNPIRTIGLEVQYFS
ncbi:Mitochondrial distribution and morphology protein 10 [Apophysomyces ossiformis]|uniref:Mitochondrial distribution and morphology protein 10 n=1 Tax=Apophysomyces ossiformis TaxID=679940 RepID=A0A8H7EVC4_9FUNG|nr:Mitochondrial distribution and morphology protein 10 [Apophysomyces ossiformis]